MQRAQLDQGGGAVDDDACGLQADQPEKQSDAGPHGMAQADRDAVEQPFAHFRQGQEHEQHTRDEYCAQCRFPVVAHGADHGVGEEGVKPHARRQAHRPVGVQAHQQAAQRGGDAGGDECRAVIDAGVGHDVGVDEDDVGHGDEGGHPGDHFGSDGAAVLLEFENPLQPARFERWGKIQRRGFGFAAFHSEYSSSLSCCYGARGLRNALGGSAREGRRLTGLLTCGSRSCSVDYAFVYKECK
ncbi:hypothetical protein D3C75_786480 [compost metagenome]